MFASKKNRVLSGLAGLLMLGLAQQAGAATWCNGGEVKDVICYGDKSCFITMDAYGGTRYYKIDGENPNKNAMVAIATSAMLSKSKVRLAFTDNGLNCADIPQNASIFGVGLTNMF